MAVLFFSGVQYILYASEYNRYYTQLLGGEGGVIFFARGLDTISPQTKIPNFQNAPWHKHKAVVKVYKVHWQGYYSSLHWSRQAWDRL